VYNLGEIGLEFGVRNCWEFFATRHDKSGVFFFFFFFLFFVIVSRFRPAALFFASRYQCVAEAASGVTKVREQACGEAGSVETSRGRARVS
jgi:hypothetical protein